MIPIYSAEQIRAWDHFTMESQRLNSIELMEQAAQSFCDWFKSLYSTQQPLTIICGNGNNGGDGLAIARILYLNHFTIKVLLHSLAKKSSADFEINLSRLPKIEVQYWEEKLKEKIHFQHNEIIIDAILGIGSRFPLPQTTQQLIHFINSQSNQKVSVDIPSGMIPDQIEMSCCVQALQTFTFESVKMCFLLPETGSNTGSLTIGKIGLDKKFLVVSPPEYQFTTDGEVRKELKVRNAFDYKNKFGHCLLIAGSHSMPGAMVLSAQSCLRSGTGLLTICSPQENRDLVVGQIPEAMYTFQVPEELSKFTAIGIGPGMGINVNILHKLLENKFDCTCIIDADALTILSEHKNLLNKLPKKTILTPHPGEFDRLFGATKNSLERINLSKKNAIKFGIWIVLKGRCTAICCPDGTVHFNSSGNVSLAKGGSGDVLFGMISSYCAQGYEPTQACILACYVHGFIADTLIGSQAIESVLPSDIIKRLPEVLLKMHTKES